MSTTLEYCRCGHVRGTHFEDPVPPVMSEGLAYALIMASHGGHPNPLFHCHVMACYCRAFTEDRRLWSKLKRKVGKR